MPGRHNLCAILYSYFGLIMIQIVNGITKVSRSHLNNNNNTMIIVRYCWDSSGKDYPDWGVFRDSTKKFWPETNTTYGNVFNKTSYSYLVFVRDKGVFNKTSYKDVVYIRSHARNTDVYNKTYCSVRSHVQIRSMKNLKISRSQIGSVSLLQ